MSNVVEARISFKDLFRLVYVLFCLYLIGDATYRWSGFRFYGTFSDFLVSAALITILWSIIAFGSTIIIWAILRSFQWTHTGSGRNDKEGQILFFLGIFIFLGGATWLGRIFLHRSTSIQEEILIAVSVIIAAGFLTRIFRKKARRLIEILIEKITPLFWLFSMWCFISVFLFCYSLYTKSDEPVLIKEAVPSSPGVQNRPNILLITFDALAAEDMSLYGYNKNTTPFMAEWAKSSTVFTRLESEDNITKPTTSSLMTGKRVWTHRSYHNIEGSSKPLDSSTQNLALVLRNNGYFTIGLIANPFASLETLNIANSFDVNIQPYELKIPGNMVSWIDNTLYKYLGNKIALYNWIVKDGFLFRGLVALFDSDLHELETPADLLFDKFLRVIDKKPAEPFFAWLHIFPPHAPYLPPEPFLGMFDSRSVIKNITDPALKRARYDEFIRYCDTQFHNFMGELSKRTQSNNTVIILSSDHGESFEHNYMGHGGKHLYEQVTHIPLVIKAVNQKSGMVKNDLIEQVDIAPTVLDLAGISKPDWMEGRSIVPLLDGEKLEPKPIYSMSLERNFVHGKSISSGTIAVWKDDFKLIHYIDENEILLFNLKEDPAESKNLFHEEKGVGPHLLSLINDELSKVNRRLADTE